MFCSNPQTCDSNKIASEPTFFDDSEALGVHTSLVSLLPSCSGSERKPLFSSSQARFRAATGGRFRLPQITTNAQDSRPKAHGSRPKAPSPRLQAHGTRLQAQSPRPGLKALRIKAEGPHLKAQRSRCKAPGYILKSQGPRPETQGFGLKAKGARPTSQGSRLEAQG